ncbi:baseplate J/gp47 family protein [Cryptosporangium sp. NPDC048952]|uniref:baseplate J/gp47 family protein n=1 Tax=Cryptosporangium sp. NPDC048952 TaxID=3363961 RepID=UPI003714AAEB
MSTDRHGAVLARLRQTLGERLPSLAGAPSDDPAIALLDAFAMVADVVGFYSDRIADEAYLPTATDDVSVRALGRAVGVELRPASPSSVLLAFTVDDAPAGAASVLVPAGTPVQSIPGQGETAQTFETVSDLVATPDRNPVGLHPTGPQLIDPGSTSVRLAGASTGLRPGDALLIRGLSDDLPWALRTIRTVVTETTAPAATRVGWTEPLREFATVPGAASGFRVRVYALRIRASLFGHNAPDWRAMPDSVKLGYVENPSDLPGTTEWPDLPLGKVNLPLDGQHTTLVPGSLLVAQQGITLELSSVSAVRHRTLANFALSGPATVVTVTPELEEITPERRQLVIHTGSEELVLAEEPVVAPLDGPELRLERAIDFLHGARVLVSGTDRYGTAHAQLAHVVSAQWSMDDTIVTLDARLATPLVPSGVRLYANVIEATAGQTVTDVLGSGDGTANHQTFSLHRPGLCGAPTVRVDGVAWTQVDSLFGSGPHDRHFVLRLDGEGVARVEFGDGVRGSRLATGIENVTATYRVGGGVASNVAPGSLTLLQRRPLGVRAVVNPIAATGGADADDVAGARALLSLRAREPDRVVTVLDHEEFASVFPGVAKARAYSLPDGRMQLTVAGPYVPGGPAAPEATLAALREALAAAGGPAERVVVSACAVRRFAVELSVVTEPDRIASDVCAAVLGAVRTAYGFDARDFAQPVTPADVLTTAQRTVGVRAVILTALHATGGLPTDLLEPSDRAVSRISAAPGRLDPADVAPAELLLVDDDLITVRELSA